MKLIKRRPDFTISKNGISSVETIEIGGINQTILIQTENIQNPILLVLHGGPSMPIPGVSNRGADYALFTCTKQLVKNFTLVYWDQRGTGRSFSKMIPKESLHLHQFVQDASEVTDYLLDRFKMTKLHLLAHSWGTVIGLLLIQKYPEKYYSYVGFSQIVNWVENDKICYQWLLKEARKANNQKAINELTSVGIPPYLEGMEQWSILRKWLFKKNSMFYNAGDKGSPSFAKGANIMFRSPDYSLMDIYRTFVLGFKLSYSKEMLHDLNTFDFFTEIPKIEIPVLFIHGKREKHVWPELIQRYYDQLDAPYKKLFWADKSSHAFHIDDARDNEKILLKYLPILSNISS